MEIKTIELLDYKVQYLEWLKANNIDIKYDSNLKADLSEFNYTYDEDCQGRYHLGWVIDQEIKFMDELTYNYDKFIVNNLSHFFFEQIGKSQFQKMLLYLYSVVNREDSADRFHAYITETELNELRRQFKLVDFEYGEISSSDVNFAIREFARIVLEEFKENKHLKNNEDFLDHFFRFDNSYGCYTLKTKRRIRIYD